MTICAEEKQTTDTGVLVWMTIGRDSLLVCETLDKAGFPCTPCHSEAEVFASLHSQTVRAAIIAEEALQQNVIHQIRDALAAQPSWSHLPIIVLTGGGNS